MNELLAPVRSRDQTFEHTVRTFARPGPRPTLVDRLSLRLGLWLLLRDDRRHRHHADHTEHSRLVVNTRTRLQRERDAAREQLLWSVRA